jgi:hypothetical protein
MTATLGELLRDGARCDRTGPAWCKALAFHEANHWVYERLEHYCLDLIAKGFTRYSTRTLIAVLRFEWDLKTSGEAVVVAGGEERSVKLNDHHTAYYARMLIEAHPRKLWDFFELRAAEGDPEEAPDGPVREVDPVDLVSDGACSDHSAPGGFHPSHGDNDDVEQRAVADDDSDQQRHGDVAVDVDEDLPEVPPVVRPEAPTVVLGPVPEDEAGPSPVSSARRHVVRRSQPPPQLTLGIV